MASVEVTVVVHIDDAELIPGEEPTDVAEALVIEALGSERGDVKDVHELTS